MSGVGDDRFLLLNDLPVEDEDSDLLGTSQVATDLADLIHGSRGNTPFVLAVDGRWGAGKSTLMRRLSGLLRDRENVEIVWFNAWTASGVSALTGMLERVLEKLDPSLVRRSFRRLNGGGLLGNALRVGVTMLAGVFRVDRAIDQLWERMSIDAKAREQARQLLQTALTSWVEQSVGSQRRTIVVFVDDLDRCGDTTAIEICEAIKLYLDLPGMVFVLGCDLGILSRIAVPGAQEPTHVRHYLEKIIQVSYRIPIPTAGALQKMIEGYATRSGTGDLLTDAMKALIAQQSAGNPRKIKRLLNSFVAEYQLDAEWREFGADGLMKAVVLQHYYPDFYQGILDSGIDHVGGLLDYQRARDWLLRARPPEEDQGEILDHHGVPIPRDSDADSLDQYRSSLAQLDQRVPPAWRSVVESAEFLALLREFGDRNERERLQQRLRRRPLSTTPTTLAPEGSRPGWTACGCCGSTTARRATKA
ncbi:P-loop NTPase fold protein [Phytohabitans flavus]|uniref:KAP family P-loop NTPase fold protein n=1 Tax=Phytohabitans flavus TaxID=1076124 RepID=UPI003637CDB8